MVRWFTLCLRGQYHLSPARDYWIVDDPNMDGTVTSPHCITSFDLWNVPNGTPEEYPI